jgi:BirA family biotin operon repressor/biotin-[acetyl-CoA-carboxylase] ligase
MELCCIHHDLVDSTSERAFAALAAGTARHGDVHVARGQTAGRGRLGRRWHSAADEGLYASLVLLPPPPAPAASIDGPLVTVAAGLAVFDAVRALGASDVRLKWPNDVVASDAKLAGVLVETRGLDPLKPHYVVGIGMNVRQLEFPSELVSERAVTSLRALGIDVSVVRALECVMDSLARRIGEISHARDRLAGAYLEATRLLDRVVVVRTAGEEHRGVLTGLSLEHGHLSVRTDTGLLDVPLGFVCELSAVPQTTPTTARG